MKIYIIGPSGSGKSTLAFELSNRHKIKHHNLDHFIYKHYKPKSRNTVSEKQYKKKINKYLNDKNWVFEGRYYLKFILDKADQVVFISPGLMKSLYWQWKRFFTNKKQREEYGFINNLKLSRSIFRQYLQNGYEHEDKKLPTVKTVNKLLKQNYKNKLTTVDNYKKYNS